VKDLRQGTLVALLVVAVAGMWLGSRTDPVQAHPESGCNSCHVPHAAHDDNSVPLWNPARTTTIATDFYTSDLMRATPGPVDGASKLCLSCHDGTNSKISTTPRTRFNETGDMGMLASSHPVSIDYSEAYNGGDSDLLDPATLGRSVVDANGKVQCTSCHEVHKTATRQEAKNLRWNYVTTGGPTTNTTAAFCRNCHVK
jgi:hypothetical protein